MKKSRFTEILGFIAGALTTFAFMPQVILVWGMRPAPADAISLSMYAILCSGVFGWVIYGIMIKSRPIIVWNATTLLLAFFVLVYKFMYG